MSIEISDVSFCIFGLKGTGKSTMRDYLANLSGGDCLIYDTLGETPPNALYDYYTPIDRYSVTELETVIANITPRSKQDIPNFIPPYRLFIIEEANRFCPAKPHPLPPKVADLNDQCRHYHIATGYIARRPVQVHSDLIELSAYLFIYKLSGKNDMRYLDDLIYHKSESGLAEAVFNLSPFEFVTVMPDRTFTVCNPIKANKEWLERAKQEKERV